MIPSGAPLSDWLTWLETLSASEIDLSLERVQAMLDRLAPSPPPHVLLVAGTNGKGSSIAMCEALLLASGMRVGAFTSPHISRYNERIVVDGTEVDDEEIIAAFERIEAVRRGIQLTYFEYGTLAALEIFAANDLDVWLLEVGLGGRLDATNAIDPTASLITNVSLDHCDWLGDDVETIATEKAGIMRPGVTTVFGDCDVPAAIKRHANDVGATLLLAGRDFDFRADDDGGWNWRGPNTSMKLQNRPGLDGDFQLGNAAAVLALLSAAGLGGELSEKLVGDRLASLTLVGRSQRMLLNNREWIFDVAHNPAAATAFAETLSEGTRSEHTIAIVGLLDDKDVSGVIEPLRHIVDRWVAVTPESNRALSANDLARQIANMCDKPCVVSDSVPGAIDFTRQSAAENDRIVVTGSFNTVGPALDYLGLNSPPES